MGSGRGCSARAGKQGRELKSNSQAEDGGPEEVPHISPGSFPRSPIPGGTCHMGSDPELGILSLPPTAYSLLLDPASTNQIESFGHVTHS